MIRRLPALLALFLTLSLLAQEPQQQPPPSPTAQQQATSPKTVQASIEQVKADTTLSDDLRASLLATYNKALEQAKATEALIANTQQYAVEKADAPSKLQKAREELKNYSPPAPPEAAAEASTTDLEQKLATAQQAQKDKAQAVSGIEADLAARVDRRARIALRQAELRKELDALPTQILDASLDPRLLTARQLGLAVERHKLEVEQQALEAELAAYDATTELLTTRRDLAAREAVARRAAADAWQQIVQQRRLAAARQAQADAEKEAAAQTHDPLLEQLAAENATLAGNLPALAAAQNLADKKRAEVEATIARIGKDIGDIKNWGDRYSEPIGQLLRERRAQLPADVGDQRAKARELQQYLIEAQRFALQFDKQSRAALEDESRIARELQRRGLPRESAVPRQADELLGKSRDMLSQTEQRLEGGLEQAARRRRSQRAAEGPDRHAAQPGQRTGAVDPQLGADLEGRLAAFGGRHRLDARPWRLARQRWLGVVVVAGRAVAAAAAAAGDGGAADAACCGGCVRTPTRRVAARTSPICPPPWPSPTRCC